ncbi:MAG: CBS domain-containing protein, partial [Nitrospirae bacterium]
LQEVLHLMRERKAGAVLVAEREQVMGIVTERDYLYRVALHDRDLETTPVTSVMTASPVTLTPNHSLAFALREMALGRYRHLPIMDDHHRCLGILSAQAILAYVLALFKMHREERQIIETPPDR